MVMNHEYDLAKLLASALKAKAPYVGIPMPGHAPLVLERERLSRGLKGVTPVHIEVQNFENGVRALLIEGRAGTHVRTRLRINCVKNAYRHYEVRRKMDAWGEAERKRRLAAASLPTFADRKQAAAYKKQSTLLAKLEKELSKLPTVWLRNPAVPQIWETRYHDTSYRDVYMAIRRGKHLRRIIGAIAAKARRGVWDSKRLYKELGLRGIEFEKYSDMTPRQREYKGADSFDLYLKHLYRFCHGTGGSYSSTYWGMVRGDDRRGDGQSWGPERYAAKLEDIRTRRALQSQIDSVKAMMSTSKPVGTSNPEVGDASELAA